MSPRRLFALVALSTFLTAVGAWIFTELSRLEPVNGEHAPWTNAAAEGADAVESRGVLTSRAREESPSRGVSRYTGRIVVSQGEALSGASVTWGAAGERGVMVMTDANGLFALAVADRDEFQINVESPGFVATRWSWSLSANADRTPESAGTSDLGEFPLPRSGAIAGRIVNERGEAMARNFHVVGYSLAHPAGGGEPSSTISTMTDPLTGEFRLAGLPSGPAEIHVIPLGGRPVRAGPVMVVAGESRPFVVEVPGSARQDHIYVQCVTSMGGPPVEADHVKLVGPDGKTRTAILGPDDRYSFSELDDGLYELRVTDPRYAPLRFAGLRPSDEIVAVAVKGLSALQLLLLDSETEIPIERYKLALCRRGWTIDEEPHVVVNIHDPRPSDGLYKDLAADEFGLWIEALGFQPTVEPVTSLTAGETREVVVRLRRERAPEGAMVKGRVLDHDLVSALTSVLVELLPDAETFGANAFDAGQGSRVEFTDRNGDFSFMGVTQGRFGLRVKGPGSRSLTSPRFAVERDGQVIDRTLVLPAGRRLSGVLTVPRELTSARGFLRLFRELTPEETLMEMLTSPVSTTARPGPDGRFFFPSLGPGRYRVVLYFPPRGPLGALHENPGFAFELGPIDLGDSDLDDVRFELPESAVGFVELVLRTGGAPLAFARIHASNDTSVDMELDADARGIVRVGPAPRQSLTIEVHDPLRIWSYIVSASAVAALPATRQEIDIPTVKTRLTLRDGRGEPIARQEVWVRAVFGASSPHFAGSPCRTDSEGCLFLTLPAMPGSVEFTWNQRNATWPIADTPAARHEIVLP